MRLIIIFFILLRSPYCFSDLAVDRTRIIINDDNPSTSFNIRNTGKTPVILQGWVSDYTQETKENSVDMVMIPPIFELMPGEIKSLKIDSFMVSNKTKENIFLLNIQQIPVASHKDIQNKVSLSFRLRLKLFLRNTQLSSVKMLDRIKLLNCKVENVKGYDSVVCLNSSGFFFTVSGLETPSDIVENDISDGLIAPFSKRTFKFPGAIPPNTNLIFLDDNGSPFSLSLQ